MSATSATYPKRSRKDIENGVIRTPAGEEVVHVFWYDRDTRSVGVLVSRRATSSCKIYQVDSFHPDDQHELFMLATITIEDGVHYHRAS